MSSLQGRGGNKSSFSWQMLLPQPTANIRRLHFGVPFLEPSDLKQAHWITLLRFQKPPRDFNNQLVYQGQRIGLIGGLSARQFNGCLPRREEKRREERDI